MCVFVGSCSGNLPAMERGGPSYSRPVMNGGQLPTNQLHDVNWGALDHASCALQLMSCTVTTMHYVHVCVYV